MTSRHFPSLLIVAGLTIVTGCGQNGSPPGPPVGKAYPTPQPVFGTAALSPAEQPLASDSSGWLPLFLWGELAVVVGVGIVLALRRWGRWHTWVVGVPVVLIIGVEMAKQVVIVLPNLY